MKEIKRCLFCGGRHTESECISPTAFEHRARMKLSLRVVELESAIQEFVDTNPMTGEDGRDFQTQFKCLLQKKT